MASEKTKSALKSFERQARAYEISSRGKKKKKVPESRLAKMARLTKMAVKGKRHKMSKAAHKAQKQLGKEQKETAAGLLIKYAKRSGKRK